MATVENKEAVDEIINNEMNNTRDKYDSPCLRVVQYDNQWKKGVFGLIFEGGDLLAYNNSPSCYNVKIYWENPKISFEYIQGKYLILRSEKYISADEVCEKINATDVCFLQVASWEAEIFCEVLGDVYMQNKGIEFYCEELQIFKVEGNVNSSAIQNELKSQFIGALEFHRGEFDKIKENLYKNKKNEHEKEKIREYINNAFLNAW